MTTTDAPKPGHGTGGSPFAALVDWGTSSFRLWMVDADGRTLGERRSGEGMLAAPEAGGFEAVLGNHLAAVGAPARLPVVVCGMAGARQGWIEAPYVDTPADLGEIVTGAVRVPGLARDVRILPGVAQREAGRPDVMRGEETQVMGLRAAGLVCLPGTHSKWVLARDGRIAGFSSFMTGEIFAVAAGQSILRLTVAQAGAVTDDEAAFAGGVEAVLTEPERILNQLFALRAAQLFGLRDAEASRSRLSGLMIGLEIAGARQAFPGERQVTLVASEPLREPYARALSAAGFETRIVDAEGAVRQGLMAAARHVAADSMRMTH